MRKFLLAVFIVALLPALSMAATEAQKRAAIDSGLAYLAGTQNPNGSFNGGGTDYLIAQTGSALLAFIEEKDNWGGNAAAYQAVVDKGLDYLLNNASLVNIGVQPHGDPDGDGNGVGVKLYPGGTNNRDTYVTGLALPAIAASGTPDKEVTVGVLAGRTDGSGTGGAWTYKDVVQNTIDYYAFGQNENGGWRYYANSGSSDQSTTQWPVISGLYASEMGVSYPGFVDSELAEWTNYIQNPATGAAGYASPTGPLGEMNETGALLIMQDYLGWSTGDVRVSKALNYINSNWTSGASGWDGNFGHPYAMWAIYKGLQTSIGLDNNSFITNLHAQGGALLDPGDTWNWWEDYCEYLVNTQTAGGSWGGYSYWGAGLATPWFINILAATEIPGSNDVIPEPTTILLFGFGLLGIAGVSRRKKNYQV